MASLCGQTEARLKDIGSMAKLVAWAFSEHPLPQKRSMKVSGSKTGKLACASSVRTMALTSKTILMRLKRLLRSQLRTNKTEKGSKYGAMAAITTDSSRMASKKASVFTFGPMAASTAAPGQTTK